MLNQLKELFGRLRGSLPPLKPIKFEDGLLHFEAQEGLKLGKTKAQADSKLGTIDLEIDILSYDEEGKFYRAKLTNEQFILDAMQVERRKEFRYDCKIRVASDDIKGQVAVTEDLSLNGARLTVNNELTSGDYLTTEFHFGDPTIKNLKVRSEVKWCSPTKGGKFHCGLRFLSIEKRQKVEIKRFIQNNVATKF